MQEISGLQGQLQPKVGASAGRGLFQERAGWEIGPFLTPVIGLFRVISEWTAQVPSPPKGQTHRPGMCSSTTWSRKAVAQLKPPHPFSKSPGWCQISRLFGPEPRASYASARSIGPRSGHASVAPRAVDSAPPARYRPEVSHRAEKVGAGQGISQEGGKGRCPEIEHGQVCEPSQTSPRSEAECGASCPGKGVARRRPKSGNCWAGMKPCSPLRGRNRIQEQNNLMGLAVGLKHVGGNPTGDLAIRVFVRKKVPKSRVSRNALVEPAINGFPTDVVEIGIPRPMSSGTGGVGPFTCGIFIHNDGIKLQNGSFEAGTLGCLVKIGSSVCLLTCNHVIANLNQARDQDPINVDGTTIAKLFMAPSLLDPPSSNTVDVAVAEIIPGAVSNELLGLPLVLPATDDVKPKDIVRKSGATRPL